MHEFQYKGKKFHNLLTQTPILQAFTALLVRFNKCLYNQLMKYRLLPHEKYPWLKKILPLFSILLVIAGTYIAVKLGQGYRPTRQGNVAGTGLLAANSFPPGAEVYINDKLTTATDDTLNLAPGQYTVKINKDGYLPWEKLLEVQAELVTQTNAELFRAVPSLSPLTLNGASRIHPAPNGQRIAFVVASASAQAKNGLYVIDLNTGPFPGGSSQPRQIAKNINQFDFATADVLWSPNSSQILVSFPNQDSLFLLDAGNTNELDRLPDVSIRLPIILSDWEAEIVERETKQFNLLPPAIALIATQSAQNVYFSPSEEKILYTATEKLNLPDQVSQPLPASNSQTQNRNLEPGNIYVYDIKEDRNFLIGTTALSKPSPTPNLKALPITNVIKKLLLLPTYQPLPISDASNSGIDQTNVPPTYDQLQDLADLANTFANFRIHYSSLYAYPLQWFPSSNHLLLTNENSLEIMEYDTTNRQTVYAGPFEQNFSYPWPDGTKLIILTNLNRTNPFLNLYTIDIK